MIDIQEDGDDVSVTVADPAALIKYWGEETVEELLKLGMTGPEMSVLALQSVMIDREPENWPQRLVRMSVVERFRDMRKRETKRR